LVPEGIPYLFSFFMLIVFIYFFFILILKCTFNE
jgi:hypothetical protein